MKIAIRAGHNFQAGGAKAILCETTEARNLLKPVIKYLKSLGHNVLDVTPGNMDVNSDLRHGVNKANSWGAELFVSVHFNKCYSSYNGFIGTEVCVAKNFDAAGRVANSLEKLGFKNRGQKVRTNLYELNATKMKSMIIETCFVEASGDVKLYKSLGVDKIGRHIAEAISNKKLDIVEDHKPGESVVQKHLYRIRKTWKDASSQKGAYTVKATAIAECKKYVGYSVFDENGIAIFAYNNVPTAPKTSFTLDLQKECNRQGFRDSDGKKLVEDGKKGPATLSALPVLRYGSKGEITKILQRILVSKGYKLVVDGVFGHNTQKAIKDIQKKNKLTADGVIGKMTWNKLL